MVNHEEPEWPPFNPFVRQTTTPLGKAKMALFCFLVPIRLLGAICTLASCLLWSNLCALGCDTSEPYSPLRRRLIVGGCRVCSRVLLFFYGFLYIRTRYEVEDPKERAEQPPAALVVVNHLGFAELLYLVVSDGCCFVSKESNRALPFIGKITQVLQGIFVSRAGEGGNTTTTTIKTTTEKILERARAPPGTWPPLALCPEGTTQTGHCLIRFATGAFRAGLPVQPVCISMPFDPKHGYDPSFSCANIVTHVLGLMTQPMNHLHVTHLAVYVPNEAEKADPKLYANNVRSKMAEQLGVGVFDLTWTDKLRFEPSPKARELGRTKLAERNDGVVPPMPIFREDPFGNNLESAKDK